MAPGGSWTTPGTPRRRFHFGRQMEAQGNIKEAVQFYSRSKRYSHAVRVAKSNGMVRELMNLALQVLGLPLADNAFISISSTWASSSLKQSQLLSSYPS